LAANNPEFDHFSLQKEHIMFFRLITFVIDARQILVDAIALRSKMTRKYGWMPE
jgi:hypothetical protein